ncbi:TetR family transcriptional regulator [Kitasatospora sp. NPDC004240]
MPRETDHDARREALCDAVVAIARRDGFTAVTVRAVAAALGASTSAVTHYYASRDELVAAAVRRELAAIEGRVTTAVGPRTGAAALLAFLGATVADAPAGDRDLWLSVVEGARRDAVLRRELAAFNAYWDGRVARHTAEAQPDPARRALLADTVDLIGSGLTALAVEDATWDAARRHALIEALLAPLLVRA